MYIEGPLPLYILITSPQLHNNDKSQLRVILYPQNQNKRLKDTQLHKPNSK